MNVRRRPLLGPRRTRFETNLIKLSTFETVDLPKLAGCHTTQPSFNGPPGASPYSTCPTSVPTALAKQLSRHTCPIKGANFRWPLVFTQRGTMFSYFYYGEKNCQGPWPSSPLNTSLTVILVILLYEIKFEGLRYHLGYSEFKISSWIRRV